MSRPEDHLIRAESKDKAGVRQLGLLTGLSRLTIEQHRLGSLAAIRLSAGRERFIFVQDGSGSMNLLPAGNEQAVDVSALLGAGDFVTLMPGESASIRAAEEGLLLTIGSAPGEIPPHRGYAPDNASN